MLDQPRLNSLGLAKAPADTRVVVAMSGGVDSSVVAAVLKDEGYDVVGVTLQLYDHGAALAKKGACCAGIDIHDARRVSEEMGFPHYVLDYESVFRESVIDEFADSYLAGSTPVPCIRCNERVKFRDLLETAQELDADCMATGHYIRRRDGMAGTELHRAADPARDQSYFLFSTTPEQLSYLRFPLGDLPTKDATRALAARYGLRVADKPDSQDICFVPDGDYAGVIEKLRPGAAEPGEIVDPAGKVLGTHKGVIHYTIGQRRGLGIGGLSEPLYVVRLDVENRRVVVGPKDMLATRTRAGARGQLAGRWRLLGCRRTRDRGQGALHPAAGPGGAAPPVRRAGRGRVADPRGGRQPRPGLRVLRHREHPHPRRRLDLARVTGRHRRLRRLPSAFIGVRRNRQEGHAETSLRPADGLSEALTRVCVVTDRAGRTRRDRASAQGDVGKDQVRDRADPSSAPFIRRSAGRPLSVDDPCRTRCASGASPQARRMPRSRPAPKRYRPRRNASP